MSNDLVYRQDVIDTLAHTTDLIDTTWTDAVGNIIEDFEEKKSIIASWVKPVPSAQPEIIYCKDCKRSSPNKVYGCRFAPFDTSENGGRMYSYDFCSRPERRTDDRE